MEQEPCRLLLLQGRRSLGGSMDVGVETGDPTALDTAIPALDISG
ncbi:MAG: hypothetical protein ABF904_07575 [Ethanoligenens sp.]